MMRMLRKCLSWVFALTSFVCLRIAFSFALRIWHLQGAFLNLRRAIVPALFLALATVFAAAWWTAFREKPSARGWGIAASLINIVIVTFDWVISFSLLSPREWSPFGLLLFIGVAGLVAFAGRFEPASPAAAARGNLRIPGDGTNDFINKIAAYLFFGVAYGAYSWWMSWCRAQGVYEHESSWHFGLMAVIALAILMTFLHELGHTTAGLALGMRLRAFVVGPFQWRVRDGKWVFRFVPRGILAPGGATGIVPAKSDLPSWRHVCTLAAGPLANLLTGVPALAIALPPHGGLFAQVRGVLALFGGWSVALFAFNLLPVRTKDGYSDGAGIYQLLSGGPWGDFHRTVAVVGSSLVTPLRPKDYDIEAILRAGRSIAHGMHGLLLRLYAYAHFLDRGRILEAGAMLREAESIYHQCPSGLPTELHPDFVFGSAYVLRDASAARGWWARMEAKKPARFNVDYWEAKSALHWIEGKLKEANEAWEKANVLAQQLPKAGAYEFERYCCSRLRQALDEAPAASG